MVQSGGGLDDLGVGEVRILAGVFQQLEEAVIVGLETVQLYLDRPIAFSRPVEILSSLFEVSNLLTKPVVLARLHL